MVTMSVEEAAKRVIQKARTLGQSLGGGGTSIAISAKRNGT
jgi:hypothetical protein